MEQSIKFAGLPEYQLEYKGLKIDLSTQKCTYGEGENEIKVHLNPQPFKTLVFLVLNRGRFVHQEEILEALDGYKRTNAMNGSCQLIGRVRKALREYNVPLEVVTEREVGVRLE